MVKFCNKSKWLKRWKFLFTGKIKKYSGFSYGKNLWGKFTGKIYGEILWQNKGKKYISFNSIENNNFCLRCIDGAGGGNSCFNRVIEYTTSAIYITFFCSTLHIQMIK